MYKRQPFYCDYGDGIYAAEGVFINFGAVILDGAKVTIGRKTLIAPGVHIYTAQHPLDADERDAYENCLPVTIGERCWIGGHATICPGVTIGDCCVILSLIHISYDNRQLWNSTDKPKRLLRLKLMPVILQSVNRTSNQEVLLVFTNERLHSLNVHFSNITLPIRCV